MESPPTCPLTGQSVGGVYRCRRRNAQLVIAGLRVTRAPRQGVRDAQREISSQRPVAVGSADDNRKPVIAAAPGAITA